MATETTRGGIWSNLGQTATGRRIQTGVGETFGFYRPGGMGTTGGPLSFMGYKGFNREAAASAFKGLARPGARWSSAKTLGKGVARGAFRAAIPGLAIYNAYSAYHKGAMFTGHKGMLGAAEELAVDVGSAVGFELAFGAIGGVKAALPFAFSVAAVAAVGYGTYKFGEAAQEYGKGLRQVEMGAEIIDRFGTMSTLRQRSLSALQNTHVNGRMALGNEALLMHATF